MRLRGPLTGVLSVVLALPPEAGLAQAPARATQSAATAPAEDLHSKYSEADYVKLKELIGNTEPKQMDLKFFKEVYRYKHAPDMLKFIFGGIDQELQAKSKRLAELRKFYDWSIQADFARKNFITIENTNQGKSNGVRSDLDATANILDFDAAKGDWVLRHKVKDLIEFQKQQYAGDGLTPDGTDVTLFDGDVFLPDWRDVRVGFDEFAERLLKNTWELKQRKGAYYSPGANKEQTHDRAFADGHTVHIGWDHVAGRPSVNGRPIVFDEESGQVKWLDYDKVTGEYKVGGPIEELITEEAATRGKVVRYQGIELLPPGERWRRALGNIVQNMKEFFEPHDPVGRNKYFIERLIDQGVGRFTRLDGKAYTITGDLDTPPTYVQIHDPDAKISTQEKTAWKKAYVQQAFGLADGDPKVAQIQDVLDRSAEIQLDKTKNRASYQDRSRHAAGDNFYFRSEWDQASANVADQIRAEGKPVSHDQLTQRQEQEAERLFVEKQQRLIPKAAVRVAQETFRREHGTPAMGPFADPEVRAKMTFERGTELALLFDVVESSPLTRAEKDSLRRDVLEAVPESSRGVLVKIAELAGLKLKLAGREGIGLERYTKASDGISDRPLWSEIVEALGADPGGPKVPEDVVQRKFRETVQMNLGPVDAARFEQAWKAGRAALIAKYGAKAYWNEITEQADAFMMAGAALGLIHAYQQNCIGQTSWNEACLTGLAWETGNQVLYMLPYVNTGYMILNGVKDLREGHYKEGATSLSLSVFSIPRVAGLFGFGAGAAVHLWVGYQMLLTAKAITYGYAMQTMENDAVEQAFKALWEPGKQARPYPAPNRSKFFDGDTPTIPLLADVITGKDVKGEYLVPAEKLTDAERNSEALVKSAAVIDSELRQSGLKAETPEWEAKRSELIVRYGMLLPYLQRTAKIHQFFAPKVAARGPENDVEMVVCLDRIDEDVQKKYSAPSSWKDQIRYWWGASTQTDDRQRDLAAGWSECVGRTVKADETVLRPVFDEYLNSWFPKQERGYAPLNDTPEFRARLANALMSEYVIHRYIDSGYENERQMKNALNRSKEKAATTLEVMGKLLSKERFVTEQLSAQLAQTAMPARVPVKPELVLHPPPYAVRLGDPAPVDVSVRGSYGAQSPVVKEWKTEIAGEVVKVSVAVPDNIIVTPELRRELSVQPGQRPKRIVTIEEKLRAQLKDSSGALLSTAETTVRYYDVIEWEGAINVEVRAAGPDVKETTLYAYAVVQLTGPQQATHETAEGTGQTQFRPLPEGSFKIHVDPRPTDTLHRPAEATVSLTGISEGAGEGGKPAILLGDGTQSVTVVLPYNAPPAVAKNSPPPNPPKQASASGPPSGPAPAPRITPDRDSTPINTQLIADCEALLRKARTAFAANDLSGATSVLNAAAQHKCSESTAAGQIDALGGEVQHTQATQRAQIQHLIQAAQQHMAACQYDRALAILRQIAELDPGNAFVTENQASLEHSAALEGNLNSLIPEAANPANDAEARTTLARLHEAQRLAPQCLLAQITGAISRLEQRLARPGARERIRAAMAACNYVDAAAAALQLQAVQPNDEWLAANLGTLQAVAAQQSNILALIRQAKSVPPGADTADLAAQLRQALATAPSCMADQIQATLAGLERGQKPAWLDGPSLPGSQTSAHDKLHDARAILELTTEAETIHQAQLAQQQHQIEVTRQEPERQAQVGQGQQEPQHPQAEHDTNRRRPPAQRRSQALNNLANGLANTLGNILSGGKLPGLPIPGGGAGAVNGAAGDPWIGVWGCEVTVTTHRNVDLIGGTRGFTRITISKTGAGYVIDDGDSREPSISVNGNQGRWAKRVQVDKHWLSGTLDAQVNGNSMTGTENVTGDEGQYLSASLSCGRR